MDYQRIYCNLIERARNRTCKGYCESHHVVPVCIGGTDEPTNLVDLYPEEHYLAHLLLVKMHPNNYKLIYAANMMASCRPSNKSYGWVRRKIAEAVSKQMKGRVFSEESKMKMRLAKLGKKLPESTKEKMRGRKHSDVTKEKFRKRKQSSETREKIANFSSNRVRGSDGKYQSAGK
jgi:hypothetical protein